MYVISLVLKLNLYRLKNSERILERISYGSRGKTIGDKKEVVALRQDDIIFDIQVYVIFNKHCC